MKTQLGDTVEFNYSGKGIHDKKPTIFFLAKVGGLVHGLNQHYQSPRPSSTISTVTTCYIPRFRFTSTNVIIFCV